MSRLFALEMITYILLEAIYRELPEEREMCLFLVRECCRPKRKAQGRKRLRQLANTSSESASSTDYEDKLCTSKRRKRRSRKLSSSSQEED